ncbi:uncharacterized protein LOC111340577 [Stylophora pistillata]|uniref:uncharacterized protein LOC111340577 n=1 Tax=Stylophora pistillata TaxID=50429 RepID=UPI000C052276|nr:uncharacterized protein LOC111340577 [Stylophora pistillata]
MADPGNTKNVPRKGPTEPLMSQREPSPELDGKSEPDDALVDRDKPPRMPVKCGAVEEVKLSLISDDPVVAHSAEIPLKYHTDPLRPSTSSHPRDEDSKLLEKVDELIATSF